MRLWWCTLGIVQVEAVVAMWFLAGRLSRPSIVCIPGQRSEGAMALRVFFGWRGYSYVSC